MRFLTCRSTRMHSTRFGLRQRRSSSASPRHFCLRVQLRASCLWRFSASNNFAPRRSRIGLRKSSGFRDAFRSFSCLASGGERISSHAPIRFTNRCGAICNSRRSVLESKKRRTSGGRWRCGACGRCAMLGNGTAIKEKFVGFADGRRQIGKD